jgi:2-haloacid dehalogenase
MHNAASHRYRAVVFDMGGVLLDWNPRHLYRKLFDGEAAVETFLATVCTVEWNRRQDAGRPIAEAVSELRARHPEEAERIAAFYDRWPETFNGPIEESVRILAELRESGTPLLLLTNASGETFPITRSVYPFLDWFPRVMVSGDVGMIKPDRRIFELLVERHGLDAAETVFIDDTPENVEAARDVGFYGIHFTTPEALRAELSGLSML